MVKNLFRESTRIDGNSFRDSALDVESSEIARECNEFISSPFRKEEYLSCRNVLASKGLERGMPTFEQAIDIIRSFGDKKLIALLRNAQKPKIVIAPKMTADEYDKFWVSDPFNERAEKREKAKKDASVALKSEDPLLLQHGRHFTVCIMDVGQDPDYLQRSGNSTTLTLGQRYDKLQDALSKDGLELPTPSAYTIASFSEYELDPNSMVVLGIGKGHAGSYEGTKPIDEKVIILAGAGDGYGGGMHANVDLSYERAAGSYSNQKPLRVRVALRKDVKAND